MRVRSSVPGYIRLHDTGGGGCDGQRTKVPILYLEGEEINFEVLQKGTGQGRLHPFHIFRAFLEWKSKLSVWSLPDWRSITLGPAISKVKANDKRDDESRTSMRKKGWMKDLQGACSKTRLNHKRRRARQPRH